MPGSKRGIGSKVPMYMIVNAIIYKLKTGVQWRYLPMESLFSGYDYSWKSVYHHFNKWSKAGAWNQIWIKMLDKHKLKLDMCHVQLDGSHTCAKRGGVGVAYQGRKKSKTSNILIMTDSRGTPLGCSNIMAGNHNDVYELEQNTDEILSMLTGANISYKGLFLNADAGFDTESFRNYCLRKEINPNIDNNPRNSNNQDSDHVLDEELYKCRYVIERTNAWIDAFKTLLVRFETSDVNWRAWHFIAFTLILIRL